MARKNTGVVTLYIILFLYLALNIYGAMHPSISNWGFNRWSVVPTNVAIVSLTFLTVFALPVYPVKFLQFFENRLVGVRRIQQTWLRRTAYFIASASVFSVLYLLRSRGHVYGDGYLTLSNVATLPENLLAGNYKFEIGSILLERTFVGLMKSVAGIPVETAFSLLTIIGGFIALIATIGLCRRVSSSKLFLSCLIASFSSGSVLLFFGHLEHYIWPLGIGLLSLYFSIDILAGRRRIPHAILTGALATFLHFMALPFLALAGIAIVKRKLEPGSRLSKNAIVACSVVSVLFAILGSFLLSTFAGVNALVPWFAKAENQYTVLSWGHLRDMLNLVVFISPLGLALPLLLFRRKVDSLQGDTTMRFIGLSGLLLFLPAFFTNPVLGAVRDWDLLAMSGIPLSVYSWQKISAGFSAKSPVRGLAPIIAVMILQISPALYEAIDAQRAAQYLDKMLWNDPHYQKDYSMAQRCVPWGAILRKNVGRTDLAEKYFVRRTQANASESSAWNTLGEIALKKKDYDSAASCFKRSLSNNPKQPDVHLRLTQSLGWSGKWQEALTVAKATIKLVPDEPKAQYNLALLLFQLGKYDQAIPTLQNITDTIIRQTTEFDACLGTSFLMTQKWDSAYTHLYRFVTQHPERKTIRESLLKSEIALGRTEEALKTLAVLKNQGYTVKTLAKYERMILQKSNNPEK